MQRRTATIRLATGLGAVALAVAVFRWWPLGVSTATVATALLLVVLVVAATSPFWVAATVSVAAMLCLNYFFLPPLGTLTIADPQNWVALIAFLGVSLIASNLSAVARARTAEALSRRDELARLFDLSRDVLGTTDSREAITALARSVARRFDLEYVAVALPRGEAWDVFDGGVGRADLDRAQLAAAFADARTRLEFDARARTYAGHRTLEVDGRPIRLVPLRFGTTPIGLLAAGGRQVEAGTLDALAGVVAIAIERAGLLEERKAAELTRQSEQLKTALLASLGHDLRTPLTAIRVAATNMRGAGLSEADRAEQGDVILAEVERLSRLFENTLEMARLDAGAVAAETRTAHPSEIMAAAREQVEHTLRGRRVETIVDSDDPVLVDPRLTARALAHLLENAAQYTSPGTPIEVRASGGADGLLIRVRDHGPGIGPSDLPHVFDRFFRGAAGQSRASGTGMGLWIARRLLAVQGGRIWVENRPEGGAAFTIAVPHAVASAATA